MQSRRPYDDNEIKTPPNLENNTNNLHSTVLNQLSSLNLNPMLIPGPLRFQNEEDVYKLLVYLKLIGKIQIQTDAICVTKIYVPDKDELIKEFVVDVKGDTYLAGHIKALITNRKIISVNLNIQADDENNLILDGEIVKTPTRANISNMDIQLLAKDNNTPIQITSFGENPHHYTYNELLAGMVATLNPTPGGLLRVIGPTDGTHINSQKIILPTSFQTKGVFEYVDNLEGKINLAAHDLIALGLRQKEALGQLRAQDTLKGHIERLRAVLVDKLNTLQQNMQDSQNSLDALTPAYLQHIQKHSQYENQSLTAVQKKWQHVIDRRDFYSSDIVGALAVSTIGIGIPFVIFDFFRLKHYKKRVEPYTTIKHYRETQVMLEENTNAYNTKKDAIKAGIALIDEILSQQVHVSEVVYQGIPVTTSSEQTFFQNASAQVNVPSKEETSNLKHSR